MEDLVIREKDIEQLGRKLMKEVYKFLHDEYILTFEEMKVQKDKIKKHLIFFYLKKLMFDEIKYKNYEEIIEDEIKYKKYLKEIEDKIEDESLDIDLIFEVLNLIDLEMEINEDLYCKKKAFLYMFLVFDHYYLYLND